MNTELKINSQNDIGIGIGSKAVENIVTIWFGLANNSEYEDLAKLIIDSNSTFQSCGLLPSELLKQNKEMREMLNDIYLHIDAVGRRLPEDSDFKQGLIGRAKNIKQFLTPKN